VRIPIWAISLTVAGIADYSTFEKAERAGVDPEWLIDDNWERCQEHGRDLREAGYLGVVAPSAALPGATSITIFGPRITSAWGKLSALKSSVPACLVAVGGPPPGLSDRVRYRGMAHSGFEAYAASRATSTLGLDEQGDGGVSDVDSLETEEDVEQDTE
jgi:hypothetical protein